MTERPKARTVQLDELLERLERLEAKLESAVDG